MVSILISLILLLVALLKACTPNLGCLRCGEVGLTGLNKVQPGPICLFLLPCCGFKIKLILMVVKLGVKPLVSKCYTFLQSLNSYSFEELLTLFWGFCEVYLFWPCAKQEYNCSYSFWVVELSSKDFIVRAYLGQLFL